MKRVMGLACWGGLMAAAMWATGARAATFTVISTADSGAGSLREAIAGVNLSPDPSNVIAFGIVAIPPIVIQPASAYAQINRPVLIDGSTQPGYSNAPVVEINGALASGATYGLRLSDSNCIVRALHVSGFTNGAGIDIISDSNAIERCRVSGNQHGIVVESGVSNLIGSSVGTNRNFIYSNAFHGVHIQLGARYTLIEGNFIGVNPANPSERYPNGGNGIHIETPDNIVRGSAAARQLVSGNTGSGIYLAGTNATRNLIVGNYIGLDISGLTAVRNGSGITLSGAPGNTIGGTNGASDRNLIGGNATDGIVIFSADSSGNIVMGNHIGLSSFGSPGVSNGNNGIEINDAPGNTIGGTNAGSGNVISGNGAGILVTGTSADGNTIQGNIIGLSAGGSNAGNDGPGITVHAGAENTLIGGSTNYGNVIAGNDDDGVSLYGSNTVVQGNRIGIDWNNVARKNAGDGLQLDNTCRNRIGGTNAAERNIISGNAGYGIRLTGVGSYSNVIQGNFVGTDGTGGVAVSNTLAGIFIFGAPRNTIGGTDAGAGNLVSGNGTEGVHIMGIQSSNNVIQGNIIGANASGSSALSTAGTHGVYIVNAPGTLIGGSATSARNVISGNNHNGIHISLATATGTVIRGNYIGVGSDGATRVPNSRTMAAAGIQISAPHTIVGGTNAGDGNVISGNANQGIYLSGANYAVIQGNYIGLDATGAISVSNNTAGIYLVNAKSNLIGGDVASARNVISGNAGPGIQAEVGSIGNVIAGNYIGLVAAGSAKAGNGDSGVFLGAGAWSNRIGGAAVGERNVISGNGLAGINVGSLASNNTVQGNYIGVDATGMFSVSNRVYGVHLDDAPNNIVGGTGAGEGNLIAGNLLAGIHMALSNAYGNRVQGNVIGLNAAGGALGNLGKGILINAASSNLIGGTDAGAGNIIANNTQDGVAVKTNSGPCVANAILGNAIYGNTGFPIDLNDDGATANDPAPDADTGPNNRQNAPQILGAYRASTHIQAQLVSAPLQTYRVELYSGSNTYQMQTFLGWTNVALPASGIGAFSVVFAATTLTGRYITATATDASSNTSESALGAIVTNAPDTDLDGIPDIWETQYGLNPAVSNAPGSDLDGDNVSDLDEYIADTAADNPNVFLKITSIANPAETEVGFPTSAGREYDFQYTADLVDGPWVQPVTNQPGTGAIMTFTDAALTTARHYRVRAALP